MAIRREDAASLRSDTSGSASSQQHLVERALEAMGGKLPVALPAPPVRPGQVGAEPGHAGAPLGAAPSPKEQGLPVGGTGGGAKPPAAVPRRLSLGPVRAGFIGLVWLVGGGLILGYGATLVYGNVARVEVDSAVVAGTIQPIRAPAAGVIIGPVLPPGTAFGAGDRLLTLHNPELEQSIAMAEVRVRRAREDLGQRVAERDAELSRRQNYLHRAHADIARIKEQVAALAEVERSVRARLDMTTKLYAHGNATRIRLEELSERAAEARSNLAREHIRLDERETLLAALIAGHGHGASEVVVRLADAEAAVRRAEAEVQLAVEELRVRLERRPDMTVRATSPGQMLRILRHDGSQVLAGDAVAIMERGDDRLIYAFLTQSEVSRVSVGDHAEVLLPAQRLAARARIVEVERAGAYLDDVESRYRWSLSRDMGQRQTDRDRSARVTLRFEGADAEAAKRVLALGTPAVVSFERRWTGGTLFTSFDPLAAVRQPAQP